MFNVDEVKLLIEESHLVLQNMLKMTSTMEALAVTLYSELELTNTQPES